MTTPTRHFLIQRSEISTLKMFVEFYQPESLELLRQLRDGVYHARPLSEVSPRIFDGPFGSDRKIDMYQSSGVPYMRVKDVLPEGIDQRELKYISQAKHEDFSRSKVIPGNVLMTIAGRVGTAAVFPDELVEGNITGHIVGIEVPDTMNPHYLAAFINSELGQFQVARWAHRTTRPELNLSEVGRILIPVPPRPVQDRIAALMQEAYAERRRMLGEAERLIQTIDSYILSELDIILEANRVSDRFVVTSHSLYSNRFDVDFHLPSTQAKYVNLRRSKKYTIVQLGGVLEQMANGATPRGANYAEDGIPFFRIQNITEDGLDLSDIKFIDQEVHEEMKRSQTRPGDLLMTITGRVGTAAVIPNDVREGNINQHIVILRVKERSINVDFLSMIINSTAVKFQTQHRTTGTTRIALDYTAIEDLLIPIPDEQIQQDLVSGVNQRRTEARRLRAEADSVVVEAKARVERMIMGEEAA